MLGNHAASILVFALALFLGAFTAVWLLDFAIVREGLCSPNSNCLVDWLGATSGWAAALAAVLTIAYLRYENRRSEAREWRRICDSAEVIYENLEPHANMIATIASRNVTSRADLKWLKPSINKALTALTDPENDEFRIASSTLRKRYSTCVRLLNQCEFLIGDIIELNQLVPFHVVATIEHTSRNLNDLLFALREVAHSVQD